MTATRASNQLRPTLSERHVNMMSFSQCIGIGLFLQSGRVIYLAGPGLGTLAFFLTGTIMWSSAACLGEMAALFPVKGPIFEFPRRFLDESLGFAAGWMTWFCWIVLIASEVVAITHIFQFRYPPDLLAEAGYPDPTVEWSPNVSPSVLVTVALILILLINLLPVRRFGQVEYIFGTVKMLFIIIMILLNTALSISQPAGRYAFWTYNSPYGFTNQNFTLPNGTVISGGVAHLAGIWEALTTCLFGMIGFETVAITAAENKDLRSEETIKIATRKISLRIITLYTLATFTVGLNVPSTYPLVVDNNVISFGYGQNSPFVVAVVLNRLRNWPYVINDFIIFTAFSAGANGLYNASRTLHALASIPEAWPDWEPFQVIRRKLEQTNYGVPYTAAIVSLLFGLLGYLANNTTSQLILGRMVRCVVVSMMMIYAMIAASYLSFHQCIKAASQGDDEKVDNKDDPDIRKLYDRNNPQYPYRSHGQYVRALYALTGCLLFIIFNGWRTFVPPMSVADFIACYIPVVLFATFFCLYKIKFNGPNPLNWRRRATLELQVPRPQVATSVPRRGDLALAQPDNLFALANFRHIGQWLWTWLK